jgi:hypothetical protein
MLSKISLCLLLAAIAFSASVPCTQYQASKNGNASDCSISRVDANTISWGARISFNVNFSWSAKSVANVLADMGSPRLPISPSKSSCDTKAGAYSKGQSVIVNCTQSFSTIPVGYANVITAFDGDDYPLGFSMKVPLSLPGILSLLRE